MYCFDTDVVSAILLPHPPARLLRRIAHVPASRQFTTAVTFGELVYGAVRRGRLEFVERARDLLWHGQAVLPFDEGAAEVYGRVKAQLEREGRRLAEPDLRVASIALARDLTLVTGNVRHFARVPGLRVENWLEA